MSDLHPDLMVAMPGPAGTDMRPIHTLLPDAYVVPEAQAQRIVRFDPRYYDAIVAGTKTATVRWQDPLAVGPALFVFEDHPEGATLDGEVLSYPLAALTATQAHLPEGTDIAGYRYRLHDHYPDLPDDVDVVVFTVTRHEG